MSQKKVKEPVRLSPPQGTSSYVCERLSKTPFLLTARRACAGAVRRCTQSVSSRERTVEKEAAARRERASGRPSALESADENGRGPRRRARQTPRLYEQLLAHGWKGFNACRWLCRNIIRRQQRTAHYKPLLLQLSARPKPEACVEPTHVRTRFVEPTRVRTWFVELSIHGCRPKAWPCR